MSLVRIPFGVDLLQQVADHVLSFPLEERGRVRVLLPHRRACRRLRALLRESAQILPRIAPLGEPDVAEFALDDVALLPEVSSQTRWLLLTWLLRHVRTAEGSEGTAEQDSLLAHSLGQVMDRLGEFDHSLSDLQIPEYADYGSHWDRLAEIIAVVQDFWPKWCAEHQCLDPIPRRNAVLSILAKSIDYPIIIAGSSGRAVAVQALMQAVLAAPQGWVYLQGLEVVSAPEIIARIPTHPGYALARLMTALDVVPEPAGRDNFYRAVFRSQSEEMPVVDHVPENLQALVLPDRNSEVGVCALLVREALAQGQSDIAVIVQDTDFVDSLERWLVRWNIGLDRVAGFPMPRTPEGRLLRLIMDIWSQGLDWVRFLALLRHPLVHCGMTRTELARCTARLESLVPEGYDDTSVAAAFRRSAEEDFRWLEPFRVLYDKPAERSVADFAGLWCATFENLCQNPDGVIPDSAAMQVLATWQERLVTMAEHLGDTPVSVADFAGMVLPMLAVLRVATPPRGAVSVSVLSAMEARLMRFDRVIIPMMNYGVVPHPPAPEPWLTRQQYQDCAMPPPEETIGLSGHDFIALCHQSEVFLLRAEKIADRMVAASVWWQRLDATWRAVRGHSMVSERQNALWQGYLAAVIVGADNPGAGRPCPNPPPEVRPKSLRVTQIQTLFCNPYEIYIRQILSLQPHPVRRSETLALRRGIFLHQLVQDFVAATPGQPEQWLQQQAETLLRTQAFTPLEAQALRYGVMRMAEQFCATERDFTGLVNQLEVAGVWNVSAVQIRGRTDRLIIDHDGIQLVDYKSGTAPGSKSITQRYQWQLPVLALMIRAGAFGALNTVKDVGYWRIGGSKTEGLHWLSGVLEEEFLHRVEQELKQRLQDMRTGDAAFLALPDPECLPDFTTMEHLTRAEEWLELAAGSAGDCDED